jgi:hypothetical protein
MGLPFCFGTQLVLAEIQPLKEVARSLLAQQTNFPGRLEEEVQARNHSVISYLKYHCELNLIERFWCAAKYFARKNCQYGLKKLRETIPAVLDSVSSASINQYYRYCLRIIFAYCDGHGYGTREFTETTSSRK